MESDFSILMECLNEVNESTKDFLNQATLTQLEDALLSLDSRKKDFDRVVLETGHPEVIIFYLSGRERILSKIKELIDGGEKE